MKPPKIRYLFSIIFTLLLSSCANIIQKEAESSTLIDTNDASVTETIEVSIVCNKQSIERYLKDGWKIQSSFVSEVPCTWKTKKATPDCNIKRDKGCGVTVPDIIGNKTTYTLIKTKAK